MLALLQLEEFLHNCPVGIKLRTSDLMGSTFTHSAVSPALQLDFSSGTYTTSDQLGISTSSLCEPLPYNKPLCRHSLLFHLSQIGDPRLLMGNKVNISKDMVISWGHIFIFTTIARRATGKGKHHRNSIA